VHADLLTSIGVSIVAAAALALIARVVRQPLILGYIAGGALLGPHLGLGLITERAEVEVISEIGLIFLLFIIGLEINIPSLVQVGRTIIIGGLLQFPICAALAWHLLGRLTESTGGEFDRLYLAVALSLSSTLIVVKLLFDKLEMGTLAGRITVGILVFQDLWAIAFLALQPSLRALEPMPLLASLGAGVALVATAGVLSRLALPALFRAVAGSHELLLLTSVAWCFLVAGMAGYLGLSKEMGALIAGMVIAAFPYGTEVIARLSGVRDFFVTLFFVALGLQVTVPSWSVLLIAGGLALFVVGSRFVSIYPVFATLGLDMRTSGVVSVNLAQISEFSLVIVTLGFGEDHVSETLLSLVLFTLVLTSVGSTYAIRYNHALATGVVAVLEATGLPRWLRLRHRPTGGSPPTHGAHDIFFLGVSREGLALVKQLERDHAAMNKRIMAIDFNPETLAQLEADGVACHYGDISNTETLLHHGIANATVIVSPISDWFLQGTDNLKLLRQVRTLVPRARVIVTADTLAAANGLYAEGADYVMIPPVLAAERLYAVLRDTSDAAMARARQRQAEELRTHRRGL
jgi:Kef-type K+ transport system membrane component KefB/Trk K+ transport system NAD-binding subunit